MDKEKFLKALDDIFQELSRRYIQASGSAERSIRNRMDEYERVLEPIIDDIKAGKYDA